MKVGAERISCAQWWGCPCCHHVWFWLTAQGPIQTTLFMSLAFFSPSSTHVLLGALSWLLSPHRARLGWSQGEGDATCAHVVKSMDLGGR